MKVVIIEDELASSRRLERMLSEYDYEIIVSLVSVKSAIIWFQNNSPPDILFLDIHLSDGLCFEIFKHVEINSVIIFTTAFSEYSIKAFDYKSISYLLKPINKEQLEKALKKAKTFYKSENKFLELQGLIECYNLSQFKTKFTVRIGKKIKIIEAKNILCFFSLNNHTYLRTQGFNYILGLSLLELVNKLNPALFFRVNRKLIIKRNAIKSIVSYSNSRLKINLSSFDEFEIIVSRERVKDFKIWLN